ncbi:MAG: hypothetical protein ABSD71_12260, partial [Bacteroidales bacterium]
ITVHEYIGVKGIKAKGKRISSHAVKKVEFLEPIPAESIQEEILPDEEVEEIRDEEVQNEGLELKHEEAETKKEKVEIKEEKPAVKSERRKAKNTGDTDEDKKKEDEGDALQMELPL